MGDRPVQDRLGLPATATLRGRVCCRSMPGSWASTANFNEVLAFIAKDALLVIDDFRPGAAERRRLEGEADRLLRAAANGAGRGRLNSDTSLRPAHPPRAMILATGEEKPSGESLIARVFLVEVAPGDIDPKRLSACQRDAASGLYAQATAGYIQWLAPRLDQVRAEMHAAYARYREQAAHAGLHRRMPGIVADLFIGWQRFLDFAHEAEALTRSEAEVYRARVWNTLIQVVSRMLSTSRRAGQRNWSRGTNNPVRKRASQPGATNPGFAGGAYRRVSRSGS